MRGRWTDRDVEQIVGNLLRVGVMLAATVVLAGGILYLAERGQTLPDYRAFHGEPTDLRSVSAILRGALALHSAAVIQFGLLLLLATPIARVAFSVLAFAAQRDRTYIIVTLIVLSVLLYSLIGPHP